jgi:nucleoside-diphosphate-sugar epimerase
LGFDVHAVRGVHGARRPPLDLPGAQLHIADLLDPDAAAALVERVMPTHLLHLAWETTPGKYSMSPENSRWLAASRQLLDCFVRHGGVRAVMAGSCAEYDWSQVSVCHEGTSPLADAAAVSPSPYAACKIALQRSLESYGRHHDLSSAWGRIFFQYGPFEHPERLVASVIGNLLRDRDAPCSHGRQIRSFLHVADVGSAFAALLDSDLEGPVNIGSEERVSLAQLVERIALQIGGDGRVRLDAIAANPGEPAILVPDVERLRDELGFQPRFALDEGLADTIAWWRSALSVTGMIVRS